MFDLLAGGRGPDGLFLYFFLNSFGERAPQDVKRVSTDPALGLAAAVPTGWSNIFFELIFLAVFFFF